MSKSRQTVPSDVLPCDGPEWHRTCWKPHAMTAPVPFRSMAIATALALLGGGCAETHEIGVPISKPDLAQLQKQLNGRKAIVTYREASPPAPIGVPDRLSTLRGRVYVDSLMVRAVD